MDKWIVNDALCHVDKGLKMTDIYVEKNWNAVWEANDTVLARFDW